jgi:hypothetical protein
MLSIRAYLLGSRFGTRVFAARLTVTQVASSQLPLPESRSTQRVANFEWRLVKEITEALCPFC